jgi:hypothetical protein
MIFLPAREWRAAMPTYTGRCHCGAVRFEVTGELRDVVDCNCSYCSRAGYLHWNVEPAQLRITQGASAYRTYAFGTGTSKNHFCPTCGISPFRVPRSDPHLLDVNVRCLDDLDLDALRIQKFDGANWETAIEKRTWK